MRKDPLPQSCITVSVSSLIRTERHTVTPRLNQINLWMCQSLGNKADLGVAILRQAFEEGQVPQKDNNRVATFQFSNFYF